MFTTLIRFATNKVFDGAQAQVWTLEFFGLFTGMRQAYTLIFQKLGLSEENIRDTIQLMTIEHTSAQMEAQRQVALSGIANLKMHFEKEALEDFERKLGYSFRFTATHPNGASSAD